MKLFLHIGTEKTGSSFIQTSFAINREGLLRQGFWYPKAGAREKDMQSGKISPGNALVLYKALKAQDFVSLKSCFIAWKNEAKDKNASSIILSNEKLLEVISSLDYFLMLEKILEELEIELKSVLLVLRDPVDQALSLYKHRAKNGQCPSLSIWLENAYFYHIYLKNFIDTVNHLENRILIKKYQTEGEGLIKLFYQDWLGIRNEINSYNQTVNPSLTLSELTLLSKIATWDNDAASDFYRRMILLPKEDKSDDSRIKDWAKNTIANFLEKFSDVFSFYNTKLIDDEQLLIKRKIEIDSSTTLEYTFSERQVKEINDFIRLQSSLTYKSKLLNAKIKRIILKTIYKIRR